MSTVKIPTSHFVLSAKRQYSDCDTAIVREAIQNSVDAGATEISIITDSESVMVIDNGCGMNEQLLVDAMLTMSGSHKSVSAIGGFGAAKEILLFQHAEYRIHTQDNFVIGNVLEYDLTKSSDYRHGTSIYMKFHPSYNYSEGNFLNCAKDWLEKCDIAAKITLNGDMVSAHRVNTIVRNLNWANVYCDDIENEQNFMHIRIKGVCMFSHYIGKINKNIVIEIIKPSIDVLTSNRDHFQWDYLQEIQKLIEEITINKSSFGIMHKTMTKYSGSCRAFISKIIYAIMKDILSVSPSEEHDQIIHSAKQQFETIKEHINNGTMEKDEAISKIKSIAINLPFGFPVIEEKEIDNHINNVDFYIQINDKGYDKVPDEISPSIKMKAKYRKMACLWRACLNHVFKSNNLEATYCIGWVIDESVEALYSRDNGIEKILLNPYLFEKTFFKNKKEMVYNMLLTAAHEVAHRSAQYHDEIFCAHYDNILNNAISSLPSYRTLLLNARTEII